MGKELKIEDRTPEVTMLSKGKHEQRLGNCGKPSGTNVHPKEPRRNRKGPVKYRKKYNPKLPGFDKRHKCSHLRSSTNSEEG